MESPAIAEADLFAERSESVPRLPSIVSRQQHQLDSLFCHRRLDVSCGGIYRHCQSLRDAEEDLGVRGLDARHQCLLASDPRVLHSASGIVLSLGEFLVC